LARFITGQPRAILPTGRLTPTGAPTAKANVNWLPQRHCSARHRVQPGMQTRVAKWILGERSGKMPPARPGGKRDSANRQPARNKRPALPQRTRRTTSDAEEEQGSDDPGGADTPASKVSFALTFPTSIRCSTLGFWVRFRMHGELSMGWGTDGYPRVPQSI
jgi:hypothetical protein